MSITSFLKNLFFEDETIHGRAISAKGYGASTIPFTFTINQLTSDKELQSNLKQWNKTRGIYYVVNAGGKSDSEISRINAVFCEIDDLPLDVQHDIFDQCEIPPSLRIETRKSVHAYWLLSEYITANDFIFLQRGLIEKFKSDASISNPSRLMRIPFFNHVHFADNQLSYKQIFIHSFNGNRFSWSELNEAFPYKPPPMPKWSKKNSDDSFEQMSAELKKRIMSTPQFRRHGDWGHTKGICHNGEGNTGLFIHFPTGAVKCFSKCSWKRIAESFGLEWRADEN